MLRRVLLALLAWPLLLSAPLIAAEPSLTLKPNDVWVMAGDSITAQRLHSNYIEAFYRTRYPQLHLQFRNSGIGGNRTNHILARFDYDVAAWKPTIVSIELGMNDVGAGDDPAAYIKGMRELIEKIRGIGAQPVLISSSPVNDGSLPDDWKGDRCRRIGPYTDALKKLAEEEKVVMVDQYHPLLVMWGKNKQADKPVNLGGDAVHPGPVGQATMAATILAGLKVEREVSAATLKADGSVVEMKRCKISEASHKDGKLAFTRLDECSAWPIAPASREALALMPEIADLSRWMLTVEGLPEGTYQVTINGMPAAKLSAKELAAGWNIAAACHGGDLATRSEQITALIAKLQNDPNKQWRAASKDKSTEKLAAAQKSIEELETQIQAACTPQPIRFEIAKE
jgi:lysophospholipase L1-like esterase